MTQLEERLRADMRAESEQIELGSIPALRLPAGPTHLAGCGAGARGTGRPG